MLNPCKIFRTADAGTPSGQQPGGRGEAQALCSLAVHTPQRQQRADSEDRAHYQADDGVLDKAGQNEGDEADRRHGDGIIDFGTPPL